MKRTWIFAVITLVLAVVAGASFSYHFIFSDSSFFDKHRINVNGRSIDLNAVVGDRRIVMFGEADHYLIGIHSLRFDMIKGLYDLGFRHFIFEEGAVGVMLVDQAAADNSSDISGINPLTGYRSRYLKDGINIIDESRRQFIDGGVAEKIESDRTAEFVKMIQLSDSDPSRPIHFWGMDFDHQDIGFIRETIGGLKLPESDEGLRWRLLALLPERSDQISSYALQEAHLNARSLWQSDNAWLKPGTNGQKENPLGLALWSLMHSLDFLGHSQEHVAWKKDQGGDFLFPMRRREAAMISRLQDLIEHKIPPSERIAILAHNLHIAKASDKIHMATRNDLASNKTYWPVLATHLSERYPNDVLSIATAFGQGRRYSPDCANGVCEKYEKYGTLENFLFDRQSDLLIPTRGAAIPRQLKDPVSMRCGHVLCWLTLNEQYDWIYYVSNFN